MELNEGHSQIYEGHRLHTFGNGLVAPQKDIHFKASMALHNLKMHVYAITGNTEMTLFQAAHV